MIKKRSTGNERRARNMIWNAAGDYNMEPAFMAYFPDGSPDYYFDTVIGLVYKWLDEKKLESIFDSYSSDRRSDEFDAFLWLEGAFGTPFDEGYERGAGGAFL